VVNAPATAGNAGSAKPAVPAQGFTGNGTDNMIVTTSGDRDHLRAGHDPVSGHPIRVVRERDNDNDRNRNRNNNVPATAAPPGTSTSTTANTTVTQTPQTNPGAPRVDTHHDTPRPQHGDVQRATPPAQSRPATAPRVEPSHPAPSAPRVQPSHPAPSAPHMEAPRMSAPHPSGASHPSGGSRSPR
jgi:hypothetical protein